MAAPVRLVSFNILQGLRPGLGDDRERRSHLVLNEAIRPLPIASWTEDF